MARDDGRLSNEFRQICKKSATLFMRSCWSWFDISVSDLKTGVISQASGSAYAENAGTKVICAVYGPRQLSGSDLEFSPVGKLRCEYKVRCPVLDAFSLRCQSCSIITVTRDQETSFASSAVNRWKSRDSISPDDKREQVSSEWPRCTGWILVLTFSFPQDKNGLETKMVIIQV